MIRSGKTAALLTALLTLTAAQAEGLPQRTAQATLPVNQKKILLLEVWINGRNTGRIIQVSITAGEYWLNKEDMTEIGFDEKALPEAIDGRINLRSLNGVDVSVENATQRLNLKVPGHFLAPLVFNLQTEKAAAGKPRADYGMSLNYDHSIQISDINHIGKTVSGGGSYTLNLFAPFGNMTNTGFFNVWPTQTSGARLDSTITFDNPEDMTKLVFGDAITGTVSTSRSVRFAGIQYSRDFTLRPDLVTIPLPTFLGRSDVPGTVDVYAGAAKIFENNLNEGPFSLSHIPIITGGTDVTIAVRDVLGRETTQTLSLYTSNNLLAEGLYDYDFDLGFLRRDYGTRSLHYDSPLAAASLRYGLTDNMTAELHGEGSQHASTLGTGASLSDGHIGMIYLGGAASHGDLGTGYMGMVSSDGHIGPLRLFGQAAVYDGRYADIASYNTQDLRGLRFRSTVGLGTNLGILGGISTSWTMSRYSGKPANSLVSTSYSFSLWHTVFFDLIGLNDLKTGQITISGYITIPLDTYGTLSGSGSYGSKTLTTRSEYYLSAPTDGGFGMRLMQQTGQFNHSLGTVYWRGDKSEADASVDVSEGVTSVQANHNGTVALMDGGVYFARHSTSSAMALVHARHKDVTIFRENRPTVKTDEDGDALVTDLIPYTTNRIGVDPRDYPMIADVHDTIRTAVPRRNSGLIVDFTPASRNPVLASIVMADGNYPRPGSLVQIIGQKKMMVLGWHGSLYFSDITVPLDGNVILDNGSCRFRVVPVKAPSENEIPREGPISCTLEKNEKK